MKKLTWLLRIIGVLQLVLGVLYLFLPDVFLLSMGHSVPKADIHYPLAMLASRFIAYGIALIYISSTPEKFTLWIFVMLLIQSIDLAAGIFYTMVHIVPLSLSGFPMFNASLIIILLLLWRPKETSR